MKTNKTLSIALAALFTSSLAFADTEVSGKVTIEHAGTINQDAFANLKDDISVRIYMDGDITNGVTYHAEVQAQSDSTKAGAYTGEYTQNAGIRELYTDIAVGDGWDARLGKQQIVWGTADGMKLLDIINPTDYAEMAQNQMEDSRIPVWALNLESGSVQAVISEPRENVFAGLNRGTDEGIRINSVTESGDLFMSDLTRAGAGGTYLGTNEDSLFRMMGPETITGEVNGFLNITPDMGGIARRFAWGFGKKTSLNDARMVGFDVDGFEGMTMGGDEGSMAWAMDNVIGVQGGGMLCLRADTDDVSNKIGKAAGIVEGVAQNDTCPTAVANANYTVSTGTAEVDAVSTYKALPDNFESAVAGVAAYFLGNVTVGATIATDTYENAAGEEITLAAVHAKAETITGAQMLAAGFQPYYNTNLADLDGVDNSAFDYMPKANFLTFNAFVNAGSQYQYDMPDSDDVDFAIRTTQTTKSGTNYSLNFSNSYDKNPIIDLSWRDQDTGALVYAVKPGGNYGDTILLNSQANALGTAYGAANDKPAILRFTQKLVRTKNIGGSFDTSFESAALGPVVIRGEALYTTDSKQPVIDKALLSIGDLQGALSMVDADRFKFVLGMDITALTNMMISAQYISDRNLDYIDTTTSTLTSSGDRYTADYATMSLSNGFNKAIEDKQYYSLFFSKPFGNSGQHRWNNITMIEEGVGENGNWNRFDVDYGLTDDVQATVEFNTYWGNANTQFGQLKDASNMQVGVKYSF
jgi:hypothetical protein